MYRRASMPMPSANFPGAHALPLLFEWFPKIPLDFRAVGATWSLALRIRNASRYLPWSASSDAVACGSLIQTTHHARLVLHVLSLSDPLLRVDVNVLRICEWTLSDSMRVQGKSVEPMPSAAAVPGSGIAGMEVWTVRLAGSNTKS